MSISNNTDKSNTINISSVFFFLHIDILLLCLGTYGYGMNDCPQSWTRDNHLHVKDDVCYLFIPQRANFDTAENYCEQKGGTLVR